MHVVWVLLVVAVICYASAAYVRRQAPLIALAYLLVAVAMTFLAFFNKPPFSTYVALPLTLFGLGLYAYGRFIKKEQVVKPIA